MSAKTLNDLQVELAEDLPIKLTTLQSEAANNPVLYGKWNRYMADIKREFITASNGRKLAMRERLMFYTGRGDDVCMDVYDKTELRVIIPASEPVLKADGLVQLIEAKMEFIKGSMEAIKQRGFAIRASIDIRKLEAGE